jgi:GcrA cell cycle regulator
MKMKAQTMPVATRALNENFIGPPTEAGAAALDVPVSKPVEKKNITTLTLTIDTCRWPLGDPTEPDFHYCGEPPLIGHSYCDRHDTQSYQSVRRKKSAA